MDPENAAIAAEQNAANKRAASRAHRQRLARSRGAAALPSAEVWILTLSGTTVEIVPTWQGATERASSLVEAFPFGQSLRVYLPSTGRSATFCRTLHVWPAGKPLVLSQEDPRRWGTVGESPLHHAMVRSLDTRDGHALCGAFGRLDGRTVTDWFVLPHENDPTSHATDHVCLACCAAVRAQKEAP